jgi:hypothetical protein
MEWLRRRWRRQGPASPARAGFLKPSIRRWRGANTAAISCRARPIIALAHCVMPASTVVTRRRLPLLPLLPSRRPRSHDGLIGCATACSPIAHGRDTRCDVDRPGLLVETRDGTGLMGGHGVQHH